MSSEADALSISPEFIEESRKLKLCTTRQGGPYSNGQRRKRRNEVFKLHFEQGIPAIQIADLMKVNRNTINDDIQWLYEKMSKDIEGDDWNGYFTKQLVRLETQRTRLLSYLSDAKELGERLTIERQLADMDLRLAAMMERFKFSHLRFWDEVARGVNKIAKEEGMEHGYTTVFERIRIPTRARKMLDEIKEEESRK